MRFNHVIQEPIITEKSTALAGENKFTFKVNVKASKGFVADELKRLFNVDAISVRTIIVPGRKRRIKSKKLKFTRTGKWKKAVVLLPEGQSVEFFSKGSK